MAYLTGAVIGVVWLWFWLQGNWFAALIAAGVLAFFWFTLPSPGLHPVWWMTVICFAGPWVPVFINAARVEQKNALRLGVR